MRTTIDEPDRDALIDIIARGVHADDIDFDNLDDEYRADVIETAIDVLDALALAGLVVIRLPAARSA